MTAAFWQLSFSGAGWLLMTVAEARVSPLPVFAQHCGYKAEAYNPQFWLGWLPPEMEDKRSVKALFRQDFLACLVLLQPLLVVVRRKSAEIGKSFPPGGL
jgi:hypothetical protein